MDFIFWLLVLIFVTALKAINAKSSRAREKAWNEATDKYNTYIDGLRANYTAPESPMITDYEIHEEVKRRLGDDPRFITYMKYGVTIPSRWYALYYVLRGQLPPWPKSHRGICGVIDLGFDGIDKINKHDGTYEWVDAFRDLYAELLEKNGFPEPILAVGTIEEREQRLKELGVYPKCWER